MKNGEKSSTVTQNQHGSIFKALALFDQLSG